MDGGTEISQLMANTQSHSRHRCIKLGLLSKLTMSVVEAFRITSCRHLETKRRTALVIKAGTTRTPVPGDRASHM